MLKQCRSAALLGFLTLAAASGVAVAKTIDTFSFSDSGQWIDLTLGEDINLSLSGSFTGVVEPGGVIAQGDLTAFQGELVIAGVRALDFLELKDLALFSFAQTGGASSLDFIDDNALQVCLGAAATLSPACNPGGAFPAGTFADFIVPALGPEPALLVYTLNAPTITLVSSITSVPEASTWAMMLAGFAGLGLAESMAFRRRRAAA
jgi:PEP-CTERM motif-containing protein